VKKQPHLLSEDLTKSLMKELDDIAEKFMWFEKLVINWFILLLLNTLFVLSLGILYISIDDCNYLCL
jgi:hypothetical protein